jgi:hypothetical protein
MTTDPDDQRTTDEEYIHRVLKYKPSSLVPWIARVGAQYTDIGSWLNLETRPESIGGCCWWP